MYSLETCSLLILSKLVDPLALPCEKLSEEQLRQLRALIEEYSDVFALSGAELGCTDLVKHFIDTVQTTALQSACSASRKDQ